MENRKICKTLGVVALVAIVASIFCISAQAASVSRSSTSTAVEPGMSGVGWTEDGTPWISMKVGNPEGNILSVLRYRVDGESAWNYVLWKGACREITYKLDKAQGAEPWTVQVQRVSTVLKDENGQPKVLEGLWI